MWGGKNLRNVNNKKIFYACHLKRNLFLKKGDGIQYVNDKF